jgi:Ca-activated chloride channel family protein
MLFLLSDGMANEGFELDDISGVLKEEKIPVYTISYTSAADKDAMQALSDVNEAASIDADSDDIIYKIKSLFNSQM